MKTPLQMEFVGQEVFKTQKEKVQIQGWKLRISPRKQNVLRTNGQRKFYQARRLNI